DALPICERWEEPAGGEHGPPDLGALLFERNPIPTSSVVLRRAALQAAGGFRAPDELEVGEDWDLWLRLAARGERFVCAPDARVRYRRHPGCAPRWDAATRGVGGAPDRRARSARDQLLDLVDVARGVKAADALGRRRAHVAAALEHPHDGGRQRVGIARRDQQAGDTVLDEL